MKTGLETPNLVKIRQNYGTVCV